MTVRAVVIDDSFVMRSLVSHTLQQDPEIEVVGGAGDPFEVIDGATYFVRSPSQPVLLVSGQQHAVVPVPTDYIVSFDLTPNADVVDSWGSIVHFTASGNNCCDCASAFYLTYFADSMSLVFASAPDFV